MDQTEEPVPSNTSGNEEEFEDESEEREKQHCANKASHAINDYRDSDQLNDYESKQVTFEENGNSVSDSEDKDAEELVRSEDEVKEEPSSTENKISETNGVGDELSHDDNDRDEDDEVDDKEAQNPSAEDDDDDDEIAKQQEENPSAELDEENTDDEENPPTDNLDTTGDSQRDSIVDSEISEEGREEQEESEKDVLQKLKNTCQYDRTSSFSSLSVNIDSTQQDSDTEFQTSACASLDSDILEESFASNENEENYEGEEQREYREELETTDEESDQINKPQEERESRLEERESRLEQSPIDSVSSLHSQEELDDNDNKPDATEDLSEEELESEDDTLNASEPGLESTMGKEEVEEESTGQAQTQEDNVEEESEETDVAEKEVPEVFVSYEKRGEEDDNGDKSQNVKLEPQKPQQVGQDDESTKVKKLGKIFQEREDQNPNAAYPKEMNQCEKSPINVRRFREIFEHGEPLLSPAAHANVSEEECTSPRPGVVKNLRDLFENPKNFEWKETVKSTTVVN